MTVRFLLAALLGLAAVPAALAQVPCPATGIRTDPAAPQNPLRPDRLNRFNWWYSSSPGPSGWRVYDLYRVSRSTGQGITYQSYTPYQQPDNTDIDHLTGTADLPANGWELLARDLGYTDRGTPRPGGASLPYVVLYHRYTGIVRVFAAVAERQADYTTHYLTLRFANGQGLPLKTGLLNRATAPATALLDAPAGVQTVLTGTGVHLNQSGKWFTADFSVDYDPCTCLFESGLEIGVAATTPFGPNGSIIGGLPGVTASGPIAGPLVLPYGGKNVQVKGLLRGLPVLGYQGQVPGALLTTGYAGWSVASPRSQ